jgi:outer membrane protein insertion porin family
MNNFIKLFFLISFGAALNATSAPISNIEISGLNAISRGTVLNYLPIEKGDDYNQKTSNSIIRALYKTKFFKNIEVSQNGQILKIKVTENPHIKYIDILNYSSDVIKKEAMQQTLSDAGLSQGQIFNAKLLAQLITQIKESYIDKGYYNTQIDKSVTTDAQNRVSITLDINEGEVARINTMSIIGAKAYTEDYLLSRFEIGKAGMFNFFTNRDHYSKVSLDAGIEAIKSLYVNNGYLDFKALETNTQLSPGKESIDIVIKINEGFVYKVGQISFGGDLLNYTAKDLGALVSVSTDDIFKRKQIVESIQSVTDSFADKGYAFAKIEPKTTENKHKKTIDLHIDISLNQKVYINRITISGNTRTQDDVIRREVGIFEGGLYSNTELNDSIENIKLLGFFSDVQMKVSKVKDAKDKINIHFSVKEDKTGTFSVGFSHSNSSGASFNLGIKEKNFLGTGNTLNAELSNSKAVKDVSFYFSDPYFTKDKHSINYGVFFKSVDGSELDVSSYKIDEKGFSLGYGVPLSKETRINTGFRFSKADVSCGTTFSGADYEQAQCASNDDTEVKANVNWSKNTLNEYNYPSTGMVTSLNVDVALPVADFRYYKIDAAHTNYKPINDDMTFKFKSRLGFADGYSGKELPFFKRYYGGGSSSVRGFDFNSLGAKYKDGTVKGGELSLLTGVSIISKVGFINDSDNMRISAFIDAGSISENSSKMESIRASVGIGFQWLTPIGPLGFYAAKPIVKKTGDKTKTFDFILGTSF